MKTIAIAILITTIILVSLATLKIGTSLVEKTITQRDQLITSLSK